MRMLVRAVTTLFLLSALSACGTIGGWFSGDDEGPKPAPLVDFDAEVKVKTQWSKRIGDGVGKKYIKLRPAIDGDRIFAVDIEGLVLALNRFNGKRDWRVKMREAVSGGIGAGFGHLFVGTRNGQVVALSQEDGSTVWRASLSSEILAVPQTNGDVVVVQTLDEKIYGLDHDSGEQLWSYESILPALTMRGTSTPVLTTSVAIVGLANGKVVALQADTGRLVWEKRLSIPQGRSELERMTDVDGDPVLLGDMVYATSFQGNTSAIELSTARVHWQKPISSFSGLGEGFGNIYVVDADDEIHAIDQMNSSSAWKQSGLSNRRLTSPTAFGNYLVVGDFEGYVHLMSQIDGHFVARRKIDGDGLRSNMIAQGDLLYIYGNSGKLVALKLK